MDSIIPALQEFADDRALGMNVAYAFAALDTDTTPGRFDTRIEHIEPATQDEIGWVSANVRPLTPPDADPYRPRDRWCDAARSLGTFTPKMLTQHANGATRKTKPIIQSMLDAGLIVQIREHVRFVSPAVYQWIGTVK